MPALPHKKAVALELLERSSVFIHLDPRKPDVIVPPAFAGQSQLVLQVGLNMAVGIPDLEVGDDGISCTLSFSRRPHYCVLPWSAIYALIGEPGRGGMVWPEDVPPEVVAQQQAGAARARPRKPKLRAVPAHRSETGPPDAGPPDTGRFEAQGADEEEDLGGVGSPAEAGAVAAVERPSEPVPRLVPVAQPLAVDAGAGGAGAGGMQADGPNAGSSGAAPTDGPSRSSSSRPSSKRPRPPYLRLVE